ncbi:hypothetical protein KX729_10045 [Rhizobium sp. XQZ8]|uniref:hypothetical protein n=1 Tax=Rhizobium populisoli TaxID=2859785 RepID=UPI001CA58093|nr:hypothetical protein [Rhizobium populisoli]MBW6421783.1 hypothetical protein [Rhizobium populisoli]
MTSPQFIRLNTDWNVEPNVPLPEISIDGLTLELRLLVTVASREGEESAAIKLTFTDCHAWLLSDLNDEGWYRGQCRYGRLAPAWGHFYEIAGEDPLRDQPDDWQSMPGHGNCHYLFYLRDETFECIANAWKAAPIRARAKVSSTSGGLIGVSGVEYLS